MHLSHKSSFLNGVAGGYFLENPPPPKKKKIKNKYSLTVKAMLDRI